MIALNLSRTTRTGQQIWLSGISGSTATLHEDSRTVPIVNGTITDTFDPDPVHIDRIP